MTCPACGRGGELVVTRVDHAAGAITVAAPADAIRFYPGMRVVIGPRRRWWQRIADGVRAFAMAVRR